MRRLGGIAQLMAAGIVIGSSVLAALPANATGPQVWWVAPTGTAASPASAGSSCANPSFVGATGAAIQSAIDGATAGDEIKICAGTYSVGATVTLGVDLTMTGVGDTLPILDGGGTSRILDVTTGGTTVTIDALHFRKGRASGGGESGAAIRVHPNATLDVNGSLFVDNHAAEHGGGIALIGSPSNSGSVHVTNSTFYNNSGIDGGGIAVVGNSNNASSVANSTFVRNRASRQGGAVNGSFAAFNATQSTFIDNLAPQGGDTSWVVAVNGSLIAYTPSVTSSNDVCNLNGATPVGNVSTSTSCLDSGQTAVTTSSLNLGFLAPWGGPVPTFSIGSGSSAINGVPGADCSTLDQRGVSRSGANCDAGAFEFVSGAGTLTASSSATIVQGRPITVTPTFTKVGLTEPVVLRVASEIDGPLPSGVTFSSSTGALGGTPASTFSGTSLIVSARDANGNVASARVEIDNCVLSLVNGEYLVATATDLDLFRQSVCGLASNYAQTANITWNATWAPPSVASTPFTGVYDGRGHSISGLQISGGETAFIPWTQNATIQNLSVSVTVTGTYSTAGLIRSADATTIGNVHVSGSVTITGDQGCHGGLVGEAINATTITDSSFDGTVAAPDSSWIGGLVGCAYENSVISGSYSDGSITGKADVGGLIGWMDRSDIGDSYAVGSVTSSDTQVGGLVGWMDGDSNDADVVAISNSYSSMSIQGNTDIGALIGEGNPTAISSSFWEDGLTGVAGLDPIGNLVPTGTQPSIVATSASQMKSFTYFDTADWSIVDGWADASTTAAPWGICDGAARPFLLWEHATDVCNASTPPSTPPSSTPSTPPSSSPSTPPSSTPSTPSTPSSPDTPPNDTNGPSVSAGGSVVYVDGQPVSSNVSWSGGNQLSGSVGVVDFTLNFGGAQGTSNASPTFTPGSQVGMNLDGLQPGSTVTATIFSAPTVLGQFTANMSGVVDASTSIPANIAAGSHRIRLEMVGNDGRAVTVWLGVQVQGTPLQLPVTGSDSPSLALLALVSTLIGAIGVVASRRRHML